MIDSFQLRMQSSLFVSRVTDFHSNSSLIELSTYSTQETSQVRHLTMTTLATSSLLRPPSSSLLFSLTKFSPLLPATLSRFSSTRLSPLLLGQNFLFSSDKLFPLLFDQALLPSTKLFEARRAELTLCHSFVLFLARAIA